VKVLAIDAYGNRVPDAAFTLSTSPGTTLSGTTSGTSATGAGSIPLGEAWFNTLSINSISSAKTDAYNLKATSGATVGTSAKFRIVSDLAACTGQTKCTNTTSNSNVATPENSYSLSAATNGTFSDVVQTTNFSSPGLDVDSQCTERGKLKTIGNAIDVRVIGTTSSSKPTTTMFVTIKQKTLQFYGISARNAAAFNVCLGALYLDGSNTGSQGSASSVPSVVPQHRTWNGIDAKGKSKAATLAKDADDLYRWWGTVADCSASFIVRTFDPCSNLKTKSASAVAAELTRVSGTTWTTSQVNTRLNYIDGDIGIFITKPFPWDGKGGVY